jgi:N-acetylglutamate synthase-like GNAT family acetyltransferase
MRGMEVRRAQPRDAPALEALYEALVPGDRNIVVDPERLAALHGDSTNYLFVLEEDGAVCGTAFLTVCLDAMYGFQPYGVVENVVVLSPARGKGAGRALMSEIERVARAERCTKLMLLSSTARLDAHAFFARMGFDAERKRGFVKYLNRAP